MNPFFASDMDALTTIVGGLGLFWILFGIVFSVMCIIMPFAVLGIYNQTRQTRLTSSQQLAEIEGQTKLLAQIRDTLKTMEAVGVEVEQTSAPLSPPSIDPRRERLRR